MQVVQEEINSHHYISGLGIVTNKKILIERGNQHDVIEVQNIKKVHLVKKRITDYTFSLVAAAIELFLIVLTSLVAHSLAKGSFLVAGFVVILFAFFIR